MKILFIYPIWQKSFYENEISNRWPPLGIAYISSYLKKHNHSVKYLERRDLIGNRFALSDDVELNELTLKAINETKPDFVGITATTPLITDAYQTARLIKKYNKDTPVIIGGCHPTAEPLRTLQECPEIDIVVIGEGEQTSLDIVSGKPLNQINGIAYRENGKIQTTTKREFYQKLDDFQFPDRHMFNPEKYFIEDSYLIRGHRIKGTNFLAARGCPFRCNFCQSGQMASSGTGNYMRLHSPEYVIEQIQQLISDFGINGLLFSEDLFSVKKDNVIKICELMIKGHLNEKIKWAANLRVDAVDKEVLRTMKSAGCIQIVYGCESGSQRTLDRMKKKTTVEKNYNAIKVTKEAGLDLEVNIMTGIPNEKEENIIETINFLKKSKPHRINRGKLYPLPGTPFYEELVNSGKIDKSIKWEDLWDKYVLQDFTFADIKPKRYLELQAKMDREVTYPINYSYHIKNNYKKSPLVAMKYVLLLLATCFILSLPVNIQRLFRKIAKVLKIQSRVVAS
ncbi:MAG: hypothetical protein A2252_07380 [Elusimicrobia bacterium RIFOXYA2_FULL_39_19]|nr:MAG: hypothetical protein A2252_07380 [Elusimicrobia bacterium RIFOXYA2_FULL_39_19]